MASEIVELEGHIIDSLILAKVLDQILAAGADYRVLDVQSLTPPAEGTYPPVCGHSGFWTRPEYRDAVNMLEASLLPAGSTTDTTAAAYPTEVLL